MNRIFLLIVLSSFCFPSVGQNLKPGEGFIDVTGGSIWYQVVGEGNDIPLLIIHGGPGAASCRLAPIKALSDERPVILYDQLGSGKSERPEDTTLWQLPRFVDELDRLIDSLQLSRVHILGHSWGCALAVEYFLTKHSEKVISMILAGPLLSTELWIEDANYLRAQLPDSIQQILNFHEKAGSIDSDEYISATDYFYHRYLYRVWPIPEYAKCDSGYFNEAIYMQMWGPTEFNATGNLVNFDRVDRLREIDIPVLLLIGEYDEVRPETMKRIQQLFPDAELEIVNGAAHVSMVDQPEEFNRIIRRFINSIN